MRGFFLLDHQDQYAASCKITAQVTRIIPRMRVTDGRETTIFIRGFWEFCRRPAMPTVALRVSDGKLDSRVQQLRTALLPFRHRCLNDEITFPQPNLIFRRVEANFNALAVEKPLRISALSLSTGCENTSLLRMLIGRRL